MGDLSPSRFGGCPLRRMPASADDLSPSRFGGCPLRRMPAPADDLCRSPKEKEVAEEKGVAEEKVVAVEQGVMGASPTNIVAD